MANAIVVIVVIIIMLFAGAAAKVSLKKGEAVVSYDREISNEELKKVVEDRGYHVVSIQSGSIRIIRLPELPIRQSREKTSRRNA